MLELKIIEKTDKDSYLDFLIQNFGEGCRAAGNNEFDCMFSDYFRKPTFFGLYQNDKLIGASCYIREWVGSAIHSLTWICIDKDFRGQGLSRKLIDMTIDKMSTVQMDGKPGTVILSCKESLCPYYEKFGFEKGPIGHELVLMSKTLNV